MTTWQRGRQIVTAERAQREGSLREFVDELRAGKAPARRVPGTAVFLNRGKQTAPLAMRANVEHNHVRHEHVVILSHRDRAGARACRTTSGITVDDLGYADDGIIHVTARFGYMETPDVPAALATARPGHRPRGSSTSTRRPTSCRRSSCGRGRRRRWPPWRKRLFIATSHITADAAEHFGLPRDRTVIMGSHIEV